jgi:hypothetical protein
LLFLLAQHMNLAEIVKGFKELNASYFIPTQWGLNQLKA